MTLVILAGLSPVDDGPMMTIRNRVYEVWKGLASLSLFFWLSGLLLVAMVVGTLAPQWNLYRQWWFAGLLGGLAVNTVACVIHRWKAIRWPSLISHVGILSILAGASVTLIWGERGSLALMEGEAGECCGRDAQQAMTVHLPFKVRLKKFWLEHYGEAKHAVRLAHRTEGWTKTLESVVVGKQYAVEGTPYKVTVKQFVPDFMIDLASKSIQSRSSTPRNPALLVALEASPTQEVWLFAKYPGMHQESLPVEVAYEYRPAQVKQFKSQVEVVGEDGKVRHEQTIWVNQPMKYAGYTFYQSGYDPEKPGLSVVEVAKDPGVPVVYTGFGVLLIGLSLNVFRKRDDSRKEKIS